MSEMLAESFQLCQACLAGAARAPRGGTTGAHTAGTLHIPRGWHCSFTQCTGKDDGGNVI